MNEQIKQLAIDATRDIKDEFGNWIGSELDKEKFGVGIVAECKKLILLMMNDGIGDFDTLDLALTEINDHFGVDE